ncbi:Mu-like prophage major head subunit gpT [Phycisphaerae bacterium RAS1]|nr:Mu-like prophage major head subunit gpT [Phycisphaerae bacterium RAS1]
MRFEQRASRRASECRRFGAAPASTGRFTADVTATITAAAADGKQPRFSATVYNGGVIRPHWTYGDKCVIDIAGAVFAEPIAALLDHDPEKIVGQSQAVTSDGQSIQVDGIVTGDWKDKEDPAGKVALHAGNGFVWKASVGGAYERVEFIEAGGTIELNGRTIAGPMHVIRACVINEFSFLSCAADGTTSARVAAAAAKEMRVDFHDWLKAKGFDPTHLNPEARDALLKAFNTEQSELKAKAAAGGNGAAPPNDPLALIEARNSRHASIREEARKFAERNGKDNDGVVSQVRAAMNCALVEDWTLERFKCHLYESLGAPEPPQTRLRGGSGRDDALSDTLLEAGLCLSLKLKDIDKRFSAQTLDLAERRWRHGLGLGQLLEFVARANSGGGSDEFSHKNPGPLLKALFAPHQNQSRFAAGPSTYDISGILSNTLNKAVVQYFLTEEDQAWSQIAAIKRVSDFKSMDSYSLQGDFQYKKVEPGGKLKDANFGEKKYSIKADTFGRLVGITRQDIINDNLGALDDLARFLGLGGIDALNDVFWTEFLDNASFFAAGNGNYISGADTALSLASLETAHTKFRKQTRPDGKPFNATPRLLLVPTELEVTANNLMDSGSVVVAGTTDLKIASGNAFKGKFAVVSSSYMSSSGFSGNSTTKWYLLADPMRTPVIAVCFLDGRDRPTIQSAMADFDELGIKVRGFFDFGVAKQEFRGGVAAKGAA